MTEPTPDAPPPDATRPHRRRPRYRGTHPRRFEEEWEEAIDATEEEFSGLSSERHSGCGLGQCGGRRWSHRTPA